VHPQQSTLDRFRRMRDRGRISPRETVPAHDGQVSQKKVTPFRVASAYREEKADILTSAYRDGQGSEDMTNRLMNGMCIRDQPETTTHAKSEMNSSPPLHKAPWVNKETSRRRSMSQQRGLQAKSPKESSGTGVGKNAERRSMSTFRPIQSASQTKSGQYHFHDPRPSMSEQLQQAPREGWVPTSFNKALKNVTTMNLKSPKNKVDRYTSIREYNKARLSAKKKKMGTPKAQELPTPPKPSLRSASDASPGSRTGSSTRKSSISGETSSTGRTDRIERARGIIEGSSSPSMTDSASSRFDRVESIRESLSGRSGLEMPSLHSSVSSARTKSTSAGENTPTTSSSKDHRRVVSPATALRNRSNSKLRSLQVDTAISSQDSRPSLYRIESPRTPTPSLDQKTVRLLYSSDFVQMIDHHKTHEALDIVQRQRMMESSEHRKSYGVSTVVRKRPISDEEKNRGEFDIIHAETGREDLGIFYDTQMRADLKTKDVNAIPFLCDSIFSETRTAEEFYIRVCQRHVLKARNGGSAACVLFGGPGSGKTHSMTDIEERVIFDIFEPASRIILAEKQRPAKVSVTYVEMCGNQCFDLLGPIGTFVRVAKSDSGSYWFRGALEKTATNAHELLQILSDAKRRLVTQAAIRKKSGPDGYIFCRISIEQKGLTGSLTLLECPSLELQKYQESRGDAVLGTSFGILMEGIKAKASGKPQNDSYRESNNLTKLLQANLKSAKSHLCLIATVDPLSTNTEGTRGVLQLLSQVAQGEEPADCRSPTENTLMSDSGNLTLPRQWTHDELVCWMTRKRLLGSVVPPDVNGHFVMRMSKRQLKNAFYDVLDDVKSERLFLALRAENDRVARLRVKQRLAEKAQN